MTAPAPPRPAVPMDPRIRARRVEVTRNEGRRRLRVLAAALGCLLAVALAVGATRSALLDVDRVVVLGGEQTDPRDVRAIAGLRSGTQMLDIKEARVAAALGRLPWVRRATVTKDWPGTVRVTIVERRPAAAIEMGPGRWALVDGEGRVLAHRSELPPDLATVVGAHEPGAPGATLGGTLAAAVDVATALSPEVRAAVPMVTIAGDELELRALKGPTVRFGPPVETEAKLHALEAVFAEVDLRRVRVIDVRVPSAPVLTRA